MRLNERLRQMAREEITEILKRTPRGLATNDLIGTPRFHGGRTLTSTQVHNVLKDAPNIEHSYVQCGAYQNYSWFKYREDKPKAR